MLEEKVTLYIQLSCVWNRHDQYKGRAAPAGTVSDYESRLHTVEDAVLRRVNLIESVSKESGTQSLHTGLSGFCK